MIQKDLFFASLTDSYGGVLSPKDTHLFYYDICYDKEDGIALCYEWNNKVQSFLDDNGLVIKPVNVGDVPSSFEDNCIFFVMEKYDNNNKAVALFRHLRNSFSHYNIGDSGNFFCMKDFYYEKGKPTDITMIGKISKRYFYSLIDIFFEQKAKIESEIKVKD